jgi:hypothetical protein
LTTGGGGQRGTLFRDSDNQSRDDSQSEQTVHFFPLERIQLRHSNITDSSIWLRILLPFNIDAMELGLPIGHSASEPAFAARVGSHQSANCVAFSFRHVCCPRSRCSFGNRHWSGGSLRGLAGVKGVTGRSMHNCSSSEHRYNDYVFFDRHEPKRLGGAVSSGLPHQLWCRQPTLLE